MAQIILVALTLINLGMCIADHGKPRKPENAWSAVVSIIIVNALLIWGGFYDNLFK